MVRLPLEEESSRVPASERDKALGIAGRTDGPEGLERETVGLSWA